MKLLAIDTSTECCSVALRADDAVWVRRHAGAREQTAHVLPLVEALLAEAGVALRDLDAVACAHGPGAFTGVRVAVSVAQGLAFGAGVPAIGISTLAALAQQIVRTTETPVPTNTLLLPALDARMGELYTGVYARADDDSVLAVAADRLCRPEEFVSGVPAERAVIAIGSGWRAYDTATLGIVPARIIEAEPDALDVLTLAARALTRGEAVSPEQLLPLYLRDTVAWKKIGEQGKK